MKLDLENLPKSKKEILIEISEQELEHYIKRAIAKLTQDMEIAGFRKGKIPEKLARQYLGEEKILTAAIEMAIEDNYVRAVIENKIEPISQPEIEIVKRPQANSESKRGSAPLIFRAKVQVLPAVELPIHYQKIAAQTKKRKITLEEKEVIETLNWLQRSRAKMSQVLRPCQKGDFVEIEFSSPQIKEAGIQKDSFILGQGRLLPGFEENLEGLMADQEKEFSLFFPQDYPQKELAGKEVKFQVKIKSVQKVELPALDDQFAREIGRFENLQNLKGKIKEGIEKEKELAENQRLKQEILEKITRATNFEVPDILVEKEKERMLQDLKQNVEQQFGLSFSDYLKGVKKSEDDLKESFSKVAQGRVKNFLVLREISQKEAIGVEESEVEAEVNEFLKRYQNLEKTEKELSHQNFAKQNIDGLDLTRLKEYIKEEIRSRKTLERLESFSRN